MPDDAATPLTLSPQSPPPARRVSVRVRKPVQRFEPTIDDSDDESCGESLGSCDTDSSLDDAADEYVYDGFVVPDSDDDEETDPAEALRVRALLGRDGWDLLQRAKRRVRALGSR